MLTALRSWFTPPLGRAQVVTLAVGVVVLVFVASLIWPAPARVRVLYEVEGTARYADVSYATPGGGGQEAPTNLPMATVSGQQGLKFEFGEGDYVFIQAQKQTVDGSITCRITVNGKVVSQDTTTESRGLVKCDARA